MVFFFHFNDTPEGGVEQPDGVGAAILLLLISNTLKKGGREGELSLALKSSLKITGQECQKHLLSNLLPGILGRKPHAQIKSLPSETCTL